MNDKKPMGLVEIDYYNKILADLKKLRKQNREFKKKNKELENRIKELEERLGGVSQNE